MLLSRLLLIILVVLCKDNLIITFGFCFLLFFYIVVESIKLKSIDISLIWEAFWSRLKKSLPILWFILFTVMMNFIFNRTGKIVFSFFDFFITIESIRYAINSVLKILSIIIISWTIDVDKIKISKIFYKYELIVKLTIRIIPEVLILFKNKKRFKSALIVTYRLVIKELKKNKNVV